MPLGTEVGLGPGNIVLDSSSPSKRGRAPPHHFSAHVYCGQTAGWMKMPLGTKLGLGPGHIVLDGDPALPTPKRGTTPNFQPISIVAKRWPISATAKHLFTKLMKKIKGERFWDTVFGNCHIQISLKSSVNAGSRGVIEV